MARESLEVVRSDPEDALAIAKMLHGHYHRLFGVVSDNNARDFLALLDPNKVDVIDGIQERITAANEAPRDPTIRHYLSARIGGTGLVGVSILASNRSGDNKGFVPNWQYGLARTYEKTVEKVTGNSIVDRHAKRKRYIPELVIAKYPSGSNFQEMTRAYKELLKGTLEDDQQRANVDASYMTYASSSEQARIVALITNGFQPKPQDSRPVPSNGGLYMQRFVK